MDFWSVLHFGSKSKFFSVLIRSNFSRRTCCMLFIRAAILFMYVLPGPTEKNVNQHVYEIYSKSLRAQLLRVKEKEAVF